MIQALEAPGSVVPAFATGLDARPAVEKFFVRDGRRRRRGGLADRLLARRRPGLVNDAHAAEEMLARARRALPVGDAGRVPDASSNGAASERGLLPVEATMMVAIPELDGSTGPMVSAGAATPAAAAAGCEPRLPHRGRDRPHDMQTCRARRRALAAASRACGSRRGAASGPGIVAVQLPPNAGAPAPRPSCRSSRALHNARSIAARRRATRRRPGDASTAARADDPGQRPAPGAPPTSIARIAADDHVRREPGSPRSRRCGARRPGRS